MEKIEKMVKLIELMNTAELVELINDCTDPYCGLRFPYIMEVEEEDKWSEIQECLGAFRVALAVENGRFRGTDMFMFVNDDGPSIYTFSDNETLFGFMPKEDIAQLFLDNEIELTIKAITK